MITNTKMDPQGVERLTLAMAAKEARKQSVEQKIAELVTLREKLGNVKYFYLREDNANSIASKLGTEYGFYAFNDMSEHRGDPIACVAYYVSATKPYTVRWALSTCNTKCDRFDKLKARLLATKRLETEGDILTLNQLQSLNDIQYMVTRRLVDNGRVPVRVKRAAKEWLFG